MAFEVVTINPGTAYAVQDTDVVVLPNGQLFTSNSDGFDAAANSFNGLSGVNLQIFGSVFSAGRGIDFWGALGGVGNFNYNTILVGATGTVSANTEGILLESGSYNQIQNYGLISGSQAIESYGGANFVIRNAGTIIGIDAFGIFVQGEIDTGNSPNAVITNLSGGSIIGSDAAIRLSNLVGTSSITNHGLISSSVGQGIDLTLVGLGQSLIHVMNYGTLEGGAGAYSGSANADSLTNRGGVFGTVDMGLGNDTLDNRGGMVEGDVILGDGTDVLDNRGGTIIGTIDGGLGNDTFLLGAGIEVVDGGTGTDAIDFRGTPAVVVSLDDSVPATGHAAGDEYVGIELVYGSYFGDSLIGSTVANTLRGYGGNDTMDGGAGADKMVGGKGVDVLTGGAASDVFVFDAVTEIGDVITDFSSVTGNHDVFNIRGSAFGGGLVLGTLAATAFQSRADNLALDADDRFIFRTTDKTLWFDADGSGAGAAVMVADLQASAVVDRFDIVII